jgi:2-polyprenyl-6-methoxyphenol hydroxylase-like FAD-dependent oxidoreductase
MNVDCDSCTVTLRSGQIHTGDAIIGADGARGVVRQTLMQEEDTSLENDIPTGIAVFWCVGDFILCVKPNSEPVLVQLSRRHL